MHTIGNLSKKYWYLYVIQLVQIVFSFFYELGGFQEGIFAPGTPISLIFTFLPNRQLSWLPTILLIFLILLSVWKNSSLGKKFSVHNNHHFLTSSICKLQVFLLVVRRLFGVPASWVWMPVHLSAPLDGFMNIVLDAHSLWTWLPIFFLLSSFLFSECEQLAQKEDVCTGVFSFIRNHRLSVSFLAVQILSILAKIIFGTPETWTYIMPDHCTLLIGVMSILTDFSSALAWFPLPVLLFSGLFLGESGDNSLSACLKKHYLATGVLCVQLISLAGLQLFGPPTIWMHSFPMAAWTLDQIVFLLTDFQAIWAWIPIIYLLCFFLIPQIPRAFDSIQKRIRDVGHEHDDKTNKFKSQKASSGIVKSDAQKSMKAIEDLRAHCSPAFEDCTGIRAIKLPNVRDRDSDRILFWKNNKIVIHDRGRSQPNLCFDYIFEKCPDHVQVTVQRDDNSVYDNFVIRPHTPPITVKAIDNNTNLWIFTWIR